MKLDDIVSNIGLESDSNTASQSPGDDLSSNVSFYDYVLNSIMSHDLKINRKFKDLQFPAVVLSARPVSEVELKTLTSTSFSNKLISSHNTGAEKTVYEIRGHIPAVSGLLPQPTFKQMFERWSGSYQTKENPAFEKSRYNILVSRFPRFYGICSSPPEIFQVWKVKFVDENFFYYGLIEDLIQPSNKIASGELARVAKKEAEERLAAAQRQLDQEQGPGLVPGTSISGYSGGLRRQTPIDFTGTQY